MTGKLPEYPDPEDKDEAADEITGDMYHWIWLDGWLAGDRNDNGHLSTLAIDAKLDRMGVQSEANRDVSHRMLTKIAEGRIKGQNAAMEERRTKR